MDFSLYLRRFVTVGLYALLFTPLVFQHRLMHSLITAKALFFEVVVAILFACYAVLALALPAYRLRRTPVLLAGAFLIAALFLSSAFGADFPRSFWSIPERMTGLFFMLHVAAFFAMLAGMIRGPLAWRTYLAWSSGASFLIALFPAFQLAFPGFFFDPAAERFSGTVGNPIFLAAYLLFHVFIAGHLAFESRARGQRTLAALFGVIALFDAGVIAMTQTRGALAGLVAGLAVLSVFYAVRPFGTDIVPPPRGRAAIAAAWTALFLLSSFFYATRAHPAWSSVPVFGRLSAQGLQAAPRLMAWRIGLVSFADRPLFGWGFENSSVGFNAHYDPRLLRYGSGEIAFDKPHNAFVQALAETGILGFAAYAAFFAILLWRSRRAPWLIALLAAYLVQDFFAFDTVTSYVMLAVIAAYAASYDLPDAHRALSGSAPNIPFAVLCIFAFAALAYFPYYPVWRASHAEWTAINEFVQKRIPEGMAAFFDVLSVRTPYIAYVRKDLAPMIGQMHRQNIALPDLRATIARAADELRAAIRDNPSNYAFLAGFAEFATTAYDVDASYLTEAEKVLADAEALSPRRQTTEYLLSKILYLKGDSEGALAALDRAVLLDPEVGEPHFYYGMLLLRTGDVPSAGRELDLAERFGRAPKNAAEAAMLGSYFGDAEDYARSIRYFQKALLYDSGDIESKLKLGLVYHFDRQHDAARNILRDVMRTEDLKKSPQYPSLLPILRELGLSK